MKFETKMSSFGLESYECLSAVGVTFTSLSFNGMPI